MPRADHPRSSRGYRQNSLAADSRLGGLLHPVQRVSLLVAPLEAEMLVQLAPAAKARG